MKIMPTFFCTVLVTSLICIMPLSADVQNGAGRALSYYNSGLEAQNNEDWYGASEAFHQALQANPVYADAWFHLAQVTYELGDYDLTLSYLTKADTYAKNRIDILNLRGITLISLGRLTESRAVFENILKQYPNDVDARFGLAELDLYNGRLDGARQFYLDALKRQTNSRKALLSLALLSAEAGKNETAQNYLQQALQYHSGEAEVHYLAAYLDAQQGDLDEAERQARAAVQIKTSYTAAYSLLASILYAKKEYTDVIDICDYLIGQNRNTPTAWYLKGLAQYRNGDSSSAITTWTTGLAVDDQDEIMRAALELLVTRTLPVEDTRRADWAAYHTEKAAEDSKKYMASESRYEYQRALRLDPQNTAAREAFAELLLQDGLSEQYIDQLKFARDQKAASAKKTTAPAAGTAAAASTAAASKTASPEDVRIADTIEGYDSLMARSLASQWGVDPFYLDKTRWRIGIYSVPSPVQLLHADAESIIAQLAGDIFNGVATTAVDVQEEPVTGYGEAFRLARESGRDYFMLLSVEETDREITINADIYSARTGTLTAHINTFRTGNDRLASAVRSLRQSVLDLLPVRGKVIKRNGNELLIDLGRTEGMVKGTQLAVIHAGSITSADQGPGIVYDPKSVLGTITLDKVGEEISSGAVASNGFFDRINIGDEVAVTSVPEDSNAQPAVTADTTPAGGTNGERVLPAKEEKTAQKKLSPEEMGLVKTPAFIQMIRNIN